MKDSVVIKRVNNGYKITRTLSETVTEQNIDERIKKIEEDIKNYSDALDNLVQNKEKLIADYKEKLEKDIKQYKKAISNLKANLQALKDAKVLGQGKASSIQNGDTQKGAE